MEVKRVDMVNAMSYGRGVGYISIDNLYRNQTVLMFRRCFALEKVHGTSAHVSFRADRNPQLIFFAGGENHERFVSLFDADTLKERLAALGHAKVTVYGEAYGGKQQGMRAVYGDELRFIAFDVKIGDHWLSVRDAEQVATGLGIEFVPYVETSTDIMELDRERDAPSIVAMRRGCGDDKVREGVVLRPLIEVTLNNGDRIIAKHKCDAFSERATPQKVVDPEKLAVLAEAQAIAQEWVTPMRLAHIMDKLLPSLDPSGMHVGFIKLDMKHTPHVIKAMVVDVYREAAGEVVESRDATAAIGKRTAALFKEWLRAQIGRTS